MYLFSIITGTVATGAMYSVLKLSSAAKNEPVTAERGVEKTGGK